MTSSKSCRPTHHASPLRYPGGKAKLSDYFKSLIRHNQLLDRTYAEPFAGGGGVALTLLLHGYVNRIVLNDLSEPIYLFWRAVIDEPEWFQERIKSASLSTSEWERQRSIFRGDISAPDREKGFAAFYLNRTNHSGVLNGGMIGGYGQNGKYGIGARFNKDELQSRIARIAKQRSKITITNFDALDMINNLQDSCGDPEPILYIDPPYYDKGRDLYYDFYEDSDHCDLCLAVRSLQPTVPWVVSYDNVKPICDLYSEYERRTYNLSYSVKNGRTGKEAMFFSPCLTPSPLAEGGLQEFCDSGKPADDLLKLETQQC
jgi:DNA adenine methylase